MDNLGINPRQVATATNSGLADILSTYQKAGGTQKLNESGLPVIAPQTPVVPKKTIPTNQSTYIGEGSPVDRTALESNDGAARGIYNDIKNVVVPKKWSR